MKNELVLCAAVALTSGLASASTVFSNGPAIYDNGAPDFLNGNELTQWLQTEDFVLGGNANVAGATFSLLNAVAGNNNANWDGGLQWWIFDSAAGNPNSIVATGNAQNIAVNFVLNNTFDFYDVSFDFGTSVALSAGTQYHFGIHMANDYSSRDELYWGTTAFNNTATGRESDGGLMNNWVDNFNEHAFTLVVPAPGATMVLGLGGLLAARRRR